MIQLNIPIYHGNNRQEWYSKAQNFRSQNKSSLLPRQDHKSSFHYPLPKNEIRNSRRLDTLKWKFSGWRRFLTESGKDWVPKKSPSWRTGVSEDMRSLVPTMAPSARRNWPQRLGVVKRLLFWPERLRPWIKQKEVSYRSWRDILKM